MPGCSARWKRRQVRAPKLSVHNCTNQLEKTLQAVKKPPEGGFQFDGVGGGI